MSKERNGIRIKDRWAKRKIGGKRYQVEVFDRHKGAYKAKRFDTRQQCKDWAEHQRARFLLGQDRAGRVPLSLVGEALLEDLSRMGRCPEYIIGVKKTIEQAMEFGITDLNSDALKQKVRKWLMSLRDIHKNRGRNNTRPITSRTRNKKLTEFKRVINFALENDYLHVDPLRGLKPETDPSRHKLKPIFRLDELRRLVSDEARAAHPYWLRFCLLIYTGCRAGEAFNMRWEWIDWEGMVMAVRQHGSYRLKQHSERLVPLQDELAMILRDHGGPAYRSLRGPILNESDHAQTRNNGCNGYNFKRFLTVNGLDVDGRSPHSCRHTWISLMLATGLNIYQVMQGSGHKVLSTVQGYAHAMPRNAVKGWPAGEIYLRRQVSEVRGAHDLRILPSIGEVG
ncbi:MAG: site-specific integrase [Planctomycetota bacterium]|nr:MAG: site-specific integrase [Planctomycetota bacterium]